MSSCIFLAALICTQGFTKAVPSPQDPNDDVEVLSGGPVSTNNGNDYDDYGGRGSFFPSFFGGGFGGPRVRVLLVPRTQSRPGSTPGGLNDLLTQLFGLGSTREVPTVQEDDQEDCGPWCTLLSNVFNVDDQIKGIQDHVNSVRDRENEIDAEDIDSEGFDINNSTHSVKVLPDGSVVHINKTIIADTDTNGNSFYIHRSVVHNIGGDTIDESVGEDEAIEEAEPAEEWVVDNSGIDDGLKE